jgi:Fe2+ transport system protein FeoA
MPAKPLKDLKPKEKGRIVRVGGSGHVRRRMLDMGVVPQAEVEMERVAPLGDPMEIRIKGYHLTLRNFEAESILVDTEG